VCGFLSCLLTVVIRKVGFVVAFKLHSSLIANFLYYVLSDAFLLILNIKNNNMITELENIANQLANARVRLSSPYQDKQTKDDILNEAKNLESLESSLRNLIYELKDKLNELSA